MFLRLVHLEYVNVAMYMYVYIYIPYSNPFKQDIQNIYSSNISFFVRYFGSRVLSVFTFCAKSPCPRFCANPD